MSKQIPVVVQYRHVHLSQQDYETLFGSERPDTLIRLAQRGQEVDCACVSVIGMRGILQDVRVLGPHRTRTQIELSATDAAAIGVKAPLRVSGDNARAASCMLKGPNGQVEAKQCVIVPARHLHLSPSIAKQLGLIHGQIVSLRHDEHPEAIDQVTVRVHPTFATEFHLTTDEAATVWLQTGDMVYVCQ